MCLLPRVILGRTERLLPPRYQRVTVIYMYKMHHLLRAPGYMATDTSEIFNQIQNVDAIRFLLTGAA